MSLALKLSRPRADSKDPCAPPPPPPPKLTAAERAERLERAVRIGCEGVPLSPEVLAALRDLLPPVDGRALAAVAQ